MATQHFCRYLKQRNQDRESKQLKNTEDSALDSKPIRAYRVDRWGTVTAVAR